jgi:hypothetical protein
MNHNPEQESAQVKLNRTKKLDANWQNQLALARV